MLRKIFMKITSSGTERPSAGVRCGRARPGRFGVDPQQLLLPRLAALAAKLVPGSEN